MEDAVGNAEALDEEYLEDADGDNNSSVEEEAAASSFDFSNEVIFSKRVQAQWVRLLAIANSLLGLSGVFNCFAVGIYFFFFLLELEAS